MAEAKSPLSAAFPIAIATGGGVGFIPLGPGTFGSLVGLLLFIPMSDLGMLVYLFAIAGLSFLGVWASSRAEQIFDSSDDGRIVIDEVVGQLIALTPLVSLVQFNLKLNDAVGGANSVLWPVGGPGTGPWSSEFRGEFIFLIVTGFVAFRWLDIYKPGVIRWVERNVSGGMGVMADDWIAGLFAAVLLAGAIAVVVSIGA